MLASGLVHMSLCWECPSSPSRSGKTRFFLQCPGQKPLLQGVPGPQADRIQRAQAGWVHASSTDTLVHHHTVPASCWSAGLSEQTTFFSWLAICILTLHPGTVVAECLAWKRHLNMFVKKMKSYTCFLQNK